MRDYFYLVSSLPMLLFHHGMPPLSYQSFLEQCRRLMDSRDVQQIEMAKLNASEFFVESRSVLRTWQMADFALRNELVKYRAKKLNLDSQQFLRSESHDPAWAPLVKDNVEDFTPLRAEMHLMELQWKLLDELQGVHQFDLDFLVVYALKLQLLERKGSFSAELGRQRLDTIIQRSRAGEYR